MISKSYVRTITWVAIFAIAMAYVESAVVVYLRDIFHPEGFEFPLKEFHDYKIGVELFREAATIFMLIAIAALAGTKLWERFAYFIFSFGIWDIFYYVWLKVILDWPSTLFDWDVLFLIPVPWIGPVIAPVSVSVLMIVFSIIMVRSIQAGLEFRPALLSLIVAIVATSVILYSFMYDTDATFKLQMPKPYRYDLLIIGDTMYIAAFVISYLKSNKM
ncbi:MAG: hypothetical protein ABFR82_07490 [Nitrospirota bacterium]